jgi:hypothetical protein
MWQLTSSSCSGEITCVNNQYSWSSSGNAADGSLFTSFLATLNGGDYYSPSAGQEMNANLPTACFANHCDWRIPTIAELNTILASSTPGCGPSLPCVDPHFLPTQSPVLSSSTVATAPNQAWLVDFSGIGASGNFKTITGYARAVRSSR